MVKHIVTYPCELCQYHDLDEWKEPCATCLATPVKENSRLAVGFKPIAVNTNHKEETKHESESRKRKDI